MREPHPPRPLWAPWRLTFVQAPPRRGCFLCLYARQRKDRSNLVVLRNRSCFALLNRFPYNSGHLMVAPRAHKSSLGALTARERTDLLNLLVEMQRALDRVLRPEGYNVGLNLGRAAGAGIPGHLHVHVVPRWTGDTNFMPLVGQTKVIPQALEDLYSRLLGVLGRGRHRSSS